MSDLHSIALAKRDPDDRLVDRAITHLQRLLHQSVIDAVVGVGDYLVATFYDGDVEAARSRDPRKPAALARLFERADELPISAYAMKRSIRLSLQYQQLPATLREGLNMKQQEALLPIADAQTKKKLGASALSRGLSGRQLGVAVRQELERQKVRRSSGRPPKAVLVKHVDALERIARDPEVAAALSSTAIRALDGHTIAQVEARLRELRTHVERLGDALARYGTR